MFRQLSVNNNRHERVTFYNVDLAYVLRQRPPYYIIDGDFNRVITLSDCTAEFRSRDTLDTHLKPHRLIEFWTNIATYGDAHAIQEPSLRVWV